MTLLNGLARAKLGQGQASEAEPLARRALEVRERVFGPDHPKLAYSLVWVSEILSALGRYEEAESLARRSLAIRERIHREAHQTTSISLDILAQICQINGNVAEAEDLYRRALTILESTVGSEHPAWLRRWRDMLACSNS
jgi:tetratricopeptide (TPR) repeat protein